MQLMDISTRPVRANLLGMTFNARFLSYGANCVTWPEGEYVGVTWNNIGTRFGLGPSPQGHRRTLCQAPQPDMGSRAERNGEGP